MDFDETTLKPFSNRELLYQQVEEQSGICDVTLQVGTWKKKFHWCVLVMSPFFESMQRSDFIEKQTDLVKLDIASPLPTEIAILFMYGKKPNLTEENVAAVLELSEFLLIPNLKSACVAFLKTISITEENCLNMLEIASLYELEISQCDEYIRGHLQDMLQKEEAGFLTKESVFALLSDPVLSYVLAEEKFKFAIRWAKASQQNKDAFPDVFAMIDLKSMDGEFLQTVVLQNSLVTDMKLDQSNLCSRDTTQDHRVLLFPVKNVDKRVACFDLESERWCGIETGLPEDDDLALFVRNASVDGTCGSKEVYRVAKRNDSCKIVIQNLHSKEYTIKTVAIPQNAVSAYAISNEIFVGVFNERKEISSRPSLSDDDLESLVMLADRDIDLATRLRIERYIHGNDDRVFKDIATVYCGQLQNSEISMRLLLTIRKTIVHSVCINANNVVGFYAKNSDTLHIYDMYHCTLDTILLSEHFGPDSRYSGIRLAAKEAGFVLYNKETVLSVSRLNGPDLTERYTVKKTKLEHDPKWNRNIYIYSNRMWFRLFRKYWKDDCEFSCISHDELMDSNVEDVAWKQLPPPTRGICTQAENNAFMMELPTSMLRCHLECPHCLPEQRQISQSAKVSRAEAGDFLYDDCDDDCDDDSDHDFSESYYYEDDFYYSSD